MKKTNKIFLYNIKTMFMVIVLLIFIRAFNSMPWWSFVIPVLILGMAVTFRKWEISSFLVGFLSGFLIWFGTNLFLDIADNGIVLKKIAILLTVNKIVVLIVSGLIGGLLTGLALYTGKSILASNKISNLDERME